MGHGRGQTGLVKFEHKYFEAAIFCSVPLKVTESFRGLMYTFLKKRGQMDEPEY